MKAWRVLIALSFLLLSGCLVTFKEPIPAREAAPPQLLGVWTSKNAWGEPLELEISRAGAGEYKAASYRKSDRRDRDEYAFTVSRHGSRWYMSAGLPNKYGGHYVMAGFELAETGELVVYNLDLDRFSQWVEQGALSGERDQVGKDSAGQGDAGKDEHLLITSPLDLVFGYLDDPANSDVFLEVARYQRQPKK
ncbi:hypothetical protein [Pseudomonas syringae]|uniref:Lipoprotein n=1 Tax=Pseudomonas syringae TaxID=317 RepID=A0A085VC72_PSESX|nr:hypothetical protein [Pseudomonas syringae]KFE53035.1 hypothetical protein IV01_21425 [Pseudomonas syringae]